MSKVYFSMVIIILSLSYPLASYSQQAFGHFDNLGTGYYTYSILTKSGTTSFHKLLPVTQQIGFTGNRIDLDSAKKWLIYDSTFSSYHKYFFAMTHPSNNDTTIAMEYGSLEHAYFVDSINAYVNVSYLMDLGVSDPYAASYPENHLSYQTIYSQNGSTVEEITDITRGILVGIRFHDAGINQTYKRFFKP